MPPKPFTVNLAHEPPPKRRLTAVVAVAAVLLILIVSGLVWFAYPRINPKVIDEPLPPAPPATPAPIYIAFNIKTEEELEFIINKVGGREAATTGQHQLAVSAHLNPLGNVYTEKEYPFIVDKTKVRAELEKLKSYQLPIVLSVFAGKFFESRITDYLEQDQTNLMFDQFNKPISLDIVGGTYFTISPSSGGLSKNEYLDLYEKNTKAIIAEVVNFINENPDLIIGVSFAGEVKYPPAKEGEGKDLVLQWADYGTFALARYRQFLQDKYDDDFEAFARAAEIPPGTFAGFATVDPPRGSNRGAWDNLDDPTNPHFLIWHEFRVDEVVNHIKQTIQWGKEAGLKESLITKIYSHQAIWEGPANYYWRGAPIETLAIPGINPVVSLYGEKTGDEDFIARVGAIAAPYPGRWGSLQYNPDGPCLEKNVCDPLGYPVAEYLRRLELAAANGARIIGVYEDDTTHFIRDNFYVAVKEFLINNNE